MTALADPKHADPVQADPVQANSVRDTLPAGFLNARPADLVTMCGELSVIHLHAERLHGQARQVRPPEKRRPVVVSMMLHGNEPAGLLTLQHLFNELGFDPQRMERGLTILVGNVSAAKLGIRRLDDQPDFNRFWTEPTGRAVRALTELRRVQPLCVLDIHNSSGQNPHFVGVTKLHRKSLGLAYAFSRHVVNVTGPTGMLAQATSDFAPSATLECGAPNDPDGFVAAANLLARVLKSGEVPLLPEGMPIEVLENLCTFKLKENAELTFPKNLEQQNFVDVPVATPLAFGPHADRGLVAIDRHGEDVTERFIRYDELGGGRFVSTSAFVPVMLTLDERVMRQDCLGYAMKRRRLELAPDD